MRSGMFLLSAALMLVLGASAVAQNQAPAESFFTGVSPKDIKFVPIDVSKAMKPFNLNRAFPAARQPAPFVLSNFLPKFTLPGWPPKKAVTPILPKSPFEGIKTFPPPKKK